MEMIAEFDPVMKEHLRRIQDKDIRRYYLGHNIHNELIELLANAVRNTIIRKFKHMKYFSIILHYTPDISHREQMTLILRSVDTSSCSIKVVEYFIEF